MRWQSVILLGVVFGHIQCYPLPNNNLTANSNGIVGSPYTPYVPVYPLTGLHGVAQSLGLLANTILNTFALMVHDLMDIITPPLAAVYQ